MRCGDAQRRRNTRKAGKVERKSEGKCGDEASFR